MMVGNIVEGLSDNNQIPHKSLGVTIFDEMTKRDKNRILLYESSNKTVTVGEFFHLTLKLAKKLTDMGVKKGDVVTIVAQNCVKSLVTIVAGFYIGATINLLNHDSTSRELKLLLEICKPVIVFATIKTLPNLIIFKEDDVLFQNIILYDEEFLESQIINFDQILADVDNGTNFTPLNLETREDVALILTSSGTTGFPKCVQLTHFNLRVAMLWVTDPNYLDINENTTLLGYLPVSHLYGIALFLGSILMGAKIVLLEKFIPDIFLQSIEKHKIEKLYAVPPTLLFLIKNPSVQKYDISSLKYIFCGASSITKQFEEMVEKKLNVIVRQLYGMTEACSAVTCTPKNLKKSGSVGTVTRTFKIRVCDPENGKELSFNQTGELRIKGDGIMKNYLRNDRETREAFDSEGYLLSGDLGYYDEDGFFYIAGRLKEIIKYKAHQVSPVEIEYLLMQHSSVKDVGVIGKPDEDTGEVALAFVVKQENQKVSADELIKYVEENLSVHKHLHGGVRFVDEIPKNSTGKIIRGKLKELL